MIWTYTGARGAVVATETVLQAEKMRSLDFSIDLILPAAL
jgi:hypothetical protein